jgi:signal transduction histidine kinase
MISAVLDDNETRIEVLDSGEGVPDDFVPHLFDRFTRASTGNASAQKGTGLGLYIVRQLALANGGTITYQRRKPTGACFVLSLPASIPNEPQDLSTDEVTAPANSAHT